MGTAVVHEVIWQVCKRRWVVCVAIALFLSYYVLLSDRPRIHLSSIARADIATYQGLQRVSQVSMLYGPHNVLYQRALRSHQRHGQRWGYRMHTLRQDVSSGFRNKPTYLLSLVVQELAKPPEERIDWLVWVDGDSIILNGEIPYEIFLPPSDLKDIHFIASKDQNGLNTGIIFLQIHPWTVSMLVEALGYPYHLPDVDLGPSADQEAMARVLKKSTGGPGGKGYQEGMIYMPRQWFNTYEFHHGYEGKKGNLLVHFPGLGDARWPHMARWLDIVETRPNEWKVPLAETEYPNATTAFWNQVRNATETIKAVQGKMGDMPRGTPDEIRAADGVKSAMEALKSALWENADDSKLVEERLEGLYKLTGTK